MKLLASCRHDRLVNKTGRQAMSVHVCSVVTETARVDLHHSTSRGRCWIKSGAPCCLINALSVTPQDLLWPFHTHPPTPTTLPLWPPTPPLATHLHHSVPLPASCPPIHLYATLLTFQKSLQFQLRNRQLCS